MLPAMRNRTPNLLVLEALGCEGPLQDPDALGAAILSAAERVGATPVSDLRYAYTGGGLTLVLLLAESHIMITTWPEESYAVAEVFLCNPAMSLAEAQIPLVEALRPAETRPTQLCLAVPLLPDPSLRFNPSLS